MTMLSGLVLVVFISSSVSQLAVFPASYNLTNIVEVNGSSATGHCRNFTNYSDGIISCRNPTTSVLFDGDIPTLTGHGLDGDMWARELLTLQPTGMAAVITFDFSNNPNFTLQRLEVVMFNCPERKTRVQSIRLEDSTREAGFIRPTTTSCSSLVRVHIPAITFTTRISLKFSPYPGSKWVHLAELIFLGNCTTCPQDTAITTTTQLTVPNTTIPSPTSTIINSSTNTTQARNEQGTNFTIILVVVLTFLLIILVCVVVAVLILWRCYCAKHHKHNNTQHTALEQSQHTSSSQAQTHTHTPLTLCEKTGQLHHASPHHAQGEDSPSHQTYSHLQHHSAGLREEVGEKPFELVGTELVASETEKSPHTQIYAQVDKKVKKHKKEKRIEADEEEMSLSLSAIYSSVDDQKNTSIQLPEIDTPVDQLYAPVDKKKKKKQATTELDTSETDTPVDQLYAQVDKKKKKKKKKKEKDVCKVSPEAVYSVVNKPCAPLKSQLFMEEVNN